MGRSLGTHGAGDRQKNALYTELSSSATDNMEFVHEAVTVTPTSTTLTTSVISDDRVGTGRKFYFGGFAALNGTTAWTTVATVTIQDTSAVSFCTVSGAATTTWAANAVVSPLTASFAYKAGYVNGGTSGKGVNIALDAAAGAGTATTFLVWGVIK